MLKDSLCKALDEKRCQKPIKKGETWFMGDVNVFDEEGVCVNFMQENGGQLSPQK